MADERDGVVRPLDGDLVNIFLFGRRSGILNEYVVWILGGSVCSNFKQSSNSMCPFQHSGLAPSLDVLPIPF